MNKAIPKQVRELINELSRLPTIGQKSAMRLAFAILTDERLDADKLASSIVEAVNNSKLCDSCFSISSDDLCEICQDETRDNGSICVVEKPQDVIALEKSGIFSGTYHVLHGLWSPVRKVSPEETKIPELVKRIKDSNGEIKEVILATSTSVEGDATAMYIGTSLKEYGVKISRISQGIPKGGDLEYIDEVTLSYALNGRVAIGE